MDLRYLIIPVLMLLTSVAGANPVTRDASDPELRRLLAEAIEESDSFNDRFDAEVWLFDMSGRMQDFVPDKEFRLDLLKSIHREATRVELPPELVIAVIEVESRFDTFAISRSGAQGLMQVMPFWLDEIGRPEDNLVDMDTNLRMGCTILKYYMDMEKNNLRGALARYNGSYGDIRHTYSNKVLDALRLRWHQK
jgi:soluble lytic murein transglycosylase-like protein